MEFIRKLADKAVEGLLNIRIPPADRRHWTGPREEKDETPPPSNEDEKEAK